MPILLNNGIGKWAKSNTILPICFLCWYLINRSPFDLFYKFVGFFPVRIIFFPFHSIIRLNFIYHGILGAQASHLSFVGILVIGTLSGITSTLLKNVLVNN
jgi:hypothetical protein